MLQDDADDAASKLMNATNKSGGVLVFDEAADVKNG